MNYRKLISHTFYRLGASKIKILILGKSKAVSYRGTFIEFDFSAYKTNRKPTTKLIF